MGSLWFAVALPFVALYAWLVFRGYRHERHPAYFRVIAFRVASVGGILFSLVAGPFLGLLAVPVVGLGFSALFISSMVSEFAGEKAFARLLQRPIRPELAHYWREAPDLWE